MIPTISRDLKKAIHFGDLEEVKRLLKLSAKIPLSKNPFLFGGYILLKLAIGLRKKSIAKLLIKKGARINKKYSNGSYSPLHHAVCQKYTDIVELLAKEGAEVNDFAHNNITSLILTAFYSTLGIAKCLLKYGADIEVKLAKSNCPGSTVFNIACIYKNFELAKLLLKHNANVNSKNLCDSYPIVDSVARNSVVLTSLLLYNGAQANCTVSEKFIETSMDVSHSVTKRIKSLGNPTLLHIAIINQKVEIVELLIDYGANIHCRTKSFQRTPLMIAIEEYNPKIVKLLLEKGARIDIFDEEGMSPLQYLICNPKNLHERLSLDMLEEREAEKIEILELLKEARANPNEVLKSIGTKLTFVKTAATYGQRGIVQYLAMGNYLDYSLIDYSIVEAAKLNINLLSKEQINDEEFMKKIIFIYAEIEFCFVKYIIRGYYSNRPVKKELLATVRSKPVNEFWNHSNYLDNVRIVEHEICQCLESMKKDKVGDSNITFWHLLTSPWNRMIHHTCNRDVRELYIDNYKDNYPPYFYILKKRINDAVKRSKLLEKAAQEAFTLFKTLPFPCCQKILNYFSDDNLEKFCSFYSL
ncbi:uncharacterized protein LOC141528622 [Cotesia typhae]|uniref:uncharacterized protein LOC141528622 n=1 Tax=Cotesia typhae TaxID=2053667 RepID=UPI003D6978DA